MKKPTGLEFLDDALAVEVSDGAAQRWLEQLKAKPNRTAADQAMIDELEAGLRQAAASDLKK